jgi:hypothetical protein
MKTLYGYIKRNQAPFCIIIIIVVIIIIVNII